MNNAACGCFIIFLMLAEYHISHIHILSSERALQPTELSTFQNVWMVPLSSVLSDEPAIFFIQLGIFGHQPPSTLFSFLHFHASKNRGSGCLSYVIHGSRSSMFFSKNSSSSCLFKFLWSTTLNKRRIGGIQTWAP